jgi:hypothetical protein
VKQNAAVIAILMAVLTFFGITSSPKSSAASDTTVELKAKSKLLGHIPNKRSGELGSKLWL